MALAQSKIYRALGGDMKLIESFCSLVAAEKPAAALAAWIAATAKDATALPISDQNITDFRQGYYARWCRHNTTLAAIRERAAQARRVVSEATAGGASLTEAARQTAMQVVADVLADFDPEALKEKLADDPAKFFALAQTITASAGVETAQATLKQRNRKLEADLRLREEQLEKLAAEREAREARLKAAATAAQAAANAPSASAEEIRQRTISLVDEVFGIKRGAHAATPEKEAPK
jgi:hypothetical protein